DYELPSSNAGSPSYEPFHHLIEGNVALAVDYAYGRRYDRKINYAIIAQSNDRIGIAPLPGGVDTVNVAHTAGLAIPSGSPNADIAMELLRYLTEDVEAYYDEIATYTLQADSDETVQDPAGYAVVLGEIKRSKPSSLLFYE